MLAAMSAVPNPRFSDPWRVLGGKGSAMFPDSAEVVELRTTLQNAEYLAFIIEQAGVVSARSGAFVRV